MHMTRGKGSGIGRAEAAQDISQTDTHLETPETDEHNVADTQTDLTAHLPADVAQSLLQDEICVNILGPRRTVQIESIRSSQKTAPSMQQLRKVAFSGQRNVVEAKAADLSDQWDSSRDLNSRIILAHRSVQEVAQLPRRQKKSHSHTQLVSDGSSTNIVEIYKSFLPIVVFYSCFSLHHTPSFAFLIAFLQVDFLLINPTPSSKKIAKENACLSHCVPSSCSRSQISFWAAQRLIQKSNTHLSVKAVSFEPRPSKNLLHLCIFCEPREQQPFRTCRKILQTPRPPKMCWNYTRA